MSERQERSESRTFLLRVWREQASPPRRRPVWRCSLEDTSTHNRRGFGSVEGLAAHLTVLALARTTPWSPEHSGKSDPE